MGRCIGAFFYDRDRYGNLHERPIECLQPAQEGSSRCAGCLFISRRELAKQVSTSQASVANILDILNNKDPRGRSGT